MDRTKRQSFNTTTILMKLFHPQFPGRRSSVGRLSFMVGSCVFAAAVALAAPHRTPASPASAKSSKTAKRAIAQGDGALPASNSESVQVMVELDAPAASAIYAEAYQAAQAQAEKLGVNRIPMAAAQKGAQQKIQIDAAATARVQNQVAQIDAAQRALLPSITNTGAHVTYRTQRAYNGIAVRVSPDRVAELAKLPGVKAVRPMTRQYATAFNDIDFLRGRSFWTKPTQNGVGLHGEGVTIAVIDTGLDYVHTNFGGPGTPEAYSVSEDKDPVPNAYYPTAKVPFGHDFAGDEYTSDNDPVPDDNPMDTNGHGTACASVAAGLGVNFGGGTYVGNYDASSPNIESMKISPGFAPGAQIVPLRVFGTEGGTFLTTEAIDYAMDPNGDGNFDDHVDVISMSLGSNNGTPDDDSAVAASNAVAAGVIVICSAGNAGDTYYITGSPGSATGAIATAASYNDQNGFASDGAVVANSPAVLRGNKAIGIQGSNSSGGTATGDIVKMLPNDSPAATTPVTNAAFLAGKIAYWDRVPGQGANAEARAKAAGAIALVIGADQTGANGDPFLLNTGATTPKFPDIVISMNDGSFIKSFSNFDSTTGVAANPINATVRPENNLVERGATGPGDTMPSYSSRGPQLSTNALKPNLTAPGEVVGVASTQTGNGAKLHNGTSSATPHVSGAIAIAKQLHPTWSVQELLALMMNTATHDLFTTTSHSTRYGVSRVGAGRVDFDSASKSDVIAFNSTDPATVSVSFGSVEVPVDGTVAITKNVTIRNKGTTNVTYNGKVDMLNTVGDANFSAPSSTFTVNAGQEITFPLLFRATGSTLKKTRDASVSNGQGVSNTTLAREWLAEAAGYGVLTPTNSSQPVIRIPLYANPKPASSMHANSTVFNAPGNTGTFNIALSGAPINTGGSVGSGAILSVVKALECQYASPLAQSTSRPNDPDRIKYVGVASDYSSVSNKKSTTLTFGIDTFGDATVPSFISSDRQVLIDLNFDGVPEFEIYLDSVRISNTSPPTHSNVYMPVLANLNNGDAFYTGYYTNLYPSNQLDVNAFNNSSVLVSVDAADLTYTGSGQSNFDYWIETYDRNTGALKERTPTMHFDIARPGFNATNGNFEPFYDADFPGQTIPVAYNGQNIQTNHSLGVLLIHRHNGNGNRSEVVTLRSPRIESFDPDHGPVGTTVTLRGRDLDASTQVRFSPNVPARAQLLSGNAIVTDVPPGAVTGPITVSNAVGASTSEDVFTVTPPPEPSPSPSPSPVESPHAGKPQALKWQRPASLER